MRKKAHKVSMMTTLQKKTKSIKTIKNFSKINMEKARINSKIKIKIIKIKKDFKMKEINRIFNNRSFKIKIKKSTINKTIFKRLLIKIISKILITSNSNKCLIQIHLIIHLISTIITSNIRIFINQIFKYKIIQTKLKFNSNTLIKMNHIIIQINRVKKIIKKRNQII